MDLALSLFMWFYKGLGGLGGWALFAACGLSAALWVLVDSTRRALPARFEKAKLLVAQLMSIPAATVHFTSQRGAFQQIGPPYDIALYLGLAGGLAAPVVALWYAHHYHGMVACKYGHRPYSATLSRCPECSFRDAVAKHNPGALAHVAADPRIHVNTHWLHIARVDAWLISPRGRRFQLFTGENRLGRGRHMQFMIVGDQAVSTDHTRIMEREGLYFVMDCGSEHGTRLNDHFLTPFVEEQLHSGDVIELTNATEVEFVVGDEGMVR